MATSQGQTLSSPFTKAVVNSMRKLYPEALADKSFDNTGLLLEAPFHLAKRQRNSVLLTVDLTRAVADEAIERGDSIIVAYHPIIFRGLKSLTLGDPQQDTLLRLVQEGISVYSPHTAVDAVPGGMADWLCDVVTGPEAATHPSLSTTEKPPLPPRNVSDPPLHTRTTIYPNPSPPEGFETAGMGRLVTFQALQPLDSLIKRISSITQGVVGLPIAIPQGRNINDINISTVATCPGSGSSILMKSGQPVADLLLTGELSHHEALAAIERGSVVITLFHSNSERGYLDSVMRSRLQAAVEDEWDIVRAEWAGTTGTGDTVISGLLNDSSVAVDVSSEDRDPYQVIAL
ncbi:YbgI/family dinuclear metal center protein [Polytolypa hystricis UAMH7299]|uniref:YbgI/family dinuclear metal center protein n=1 Tax=Polytolypa hystricis (strain UAMH7299) TaxID=1447883 RepID=A0A2B7Z0H8_POLH7|nr:YbgI/family dinuclear metal center protein [Polytolypa hystricis UAMH7299]